MKPPLQTILLLALPASGKSEVRRYIDHVDAATRARDLRMGPTVQLDDFPYVHMMRCVDDALEQFGKARHYFAASDRPFIDARHWGTLIELLNEDYDDLVARRRVLPPQPGRSMLDRMDAAAGIAGATMLLDRIAGPVLERLIAAIEKDARAVTEEKIAAIPDSLDGKTLVIEFSRGGPENATMPLPDPVGYRFALSRLLPAILEKATVLYIWVEPEESRRKNLARSKPDEQGSILHHGVPEIVMRVDYGCDDIAWLLEQSSVPGSVTIENRGRTFHIPTARFDNRVDKTSFLRGEPSAWNAADVKALHEGLCSAISSLR
ncbi:MAG: hypothetical protein AAB229_05195 [Candidatus Hydrogenedentota bacterium]